MSGEQLCVLTGVNAQGDCFLDLACAGPPAKDTLSRLLEGRVLSGAIAATDKRDAYAAPLAAVGVAVHRMVGSRERSAESINLVNSLHSRLEAFLRPFMGVSARRLHHYLMWFKWTETARRAGGFREKVSLAVSQMRSGRYSTKWRDYWTTPYPAFG